jgi:alpha-L-rhamnosidase
MTQNPVSVTHLRSQHPTTLIGLPGEAPLLRWSIKSLTSGLNQLGYEIEASTSPDFAKTSDKFAARGSVQFGVRAPGGNLKSREVRYYRVRVETEAGWSPWSTAYCYEAGLLSASDFSASAISDGSSHSEPAALFRREFSASSKPVKARLYASAHGVFDAKINGVGVAHEFLNPGWTAYQDRLNVAAFDVTNLIREGANVIGLELADGWYRGKLGFMNKYDNYGSQTAVIAQLEITFEDGSLQTIGTDESFKSSTGEVRFASIYDGTTTDYNFEQCGWSEPGFDDSSWAAAKLGEINKDLLRMRFAEPIQELQKFPMTLAVHSDRVQLDAGQNVSGWVSLVVDGKKGQTVTVRHSEILNPDGSLHTKALRSAKATDVYTLAKDGRQTLMPKFTFHGFQHADVVTDAEVVSGVAVAVSSNTAKRSHFESSDTRLNRLHENVVWSQRDNFVGLPTDCPQRDERLGWTGDAQAFAYAANTLVDAEAFWRSWLIDLELDQDEEGNVAAVVPDLISLQPVPAGDWVVMGRAGWADAATIVPFSAYETFGSIDILEQQLRSMRRWTDALHNRRKGEKFLPTEFQFGDWCDPDAPSNRPWDAKVSADFVANSFFAHTAVLTARTERLVGSEEGAKHYQDMADELKKSIWAEFGEHAKSTTAGCSIALEFEICPEGEREEVAKILAGMVRKDNGMITTGFLGTPLILHALSKAGYFEEAYLMLMRREVRSWLYQVERGATTIWERWDAIKEDGTIHAGEMDTANEHQEDESMISFNHYAYGAVVDWIYRNVAGLAPTAADPGYRTTIVAPRPASGFSSAEACIKTSYGNVSIDWEVDGCGYLRACLSVPFGVTAQLDLPLSADSELFVNGESMTNGSSVGYGEYVISVSKPSIISFK